MTVTLYSTHCPQCIFLEKILSSKHIDVNVVTDVAEIQRVAAACGYSTVPILQVDDAFFPSADAIRWANAYEEEVSGDADDCGQVSSVQEGH